MGLGSEIGGVGSRQYQLQACRRQTWRVQPRASRIRPRTWPQQAHVYHSTFQSAEVRCQTSTPESQRTTQWLAKKNCPLCPWQATKLWSTSLNNALMAKHTLVHLVRSTRVAHRSATPWLSNFFFARLPFLPPIASPLSLNLLLRALCTCLSPSST